MESKPKVVSLLFSGGVDSTTAALLLAEKYDRVHLLSFGNGYGHYRIGRTRRRAEELVKHCGNKFEYFTCSVRALFERILHDPLGDYRRFRSGFIWCMSCKLAMHTRAIMYNIQHGIEEVADGSSGSTAEMVEQMPLSIGMIRKLYEDFGMKFLTPVYDLSREQEIAELKRLGFKMGLRIGNRFLGIQPKCRPGELYYLPFILLKQWPKHDEEAVCTFILEKTRIVKEIIEHWKEEKSHGC